VEQIALADRLVITKTDAAGGDEVARLSALLGRMNARARQLRVIAGEVEPAMLFGAGLDDGVSTVAGALDWLHAPAQHRRDEMEQPARQHGECSLHRRDVESFTLSVDFPLEWRPFQEWLTGVRIRHAAELLRVKGILAVRGEARPVAVHGVHHVFHPPIRLALERAPWPGGRIVFIVRGAVRPAIEAGWRSLLAASGVPPGAGDSKSSMERAA